MTTIFAQLHEEWARLAPSPVMTAALRRWGRADDRLRFSSIDELVAATQQRNDPVASDAVLAALAARAPADDLAARALLQLVLPGLRAVARRHPWLGNEEEGRAVVVAAAYERIRTYPIERRPERIAANVVGDVRQRVLADRARRRTAEAELCMSNLEGADEGRGGHFHPAPPTRPISQDEGESATTELLELLGWACRRGHLSRAGTQLIALTRVADVPAAELVGRFGRDPHSIRRQRLRHEGRLKAAVLAAA